MIPAITLGILAGLSWLAYEAHAARRQLQARLAQERAYRERVEAWAEQSVRRARVYLLDPARSEWSRRN